MSHFPTMSAMTIKQRTLLMVKAKGSFPKSILHKHLKEFKLKTKSILRNSKKVVFDGRDFEDIFDSTTSIHDKQNQDLSHVFMEEWIIDKIYLRSSSHRKKQLLQANPYP